MSKQRVIYGPWRLPGNWGLRVIAPQQGESLPLVERDWAPNSVIADRQDEDWRLEKSATAREVAAELVRVAEERDLAVRVAAEAGQEAALREFAAALPASPDPASHRLAQLRAECSSPGWDSYGAEPLTERALEVAAVLLSPATVVPTSAGGIQLEWHRSGEDIEIEILPDGNVIVRNEGGEL